MTFLFLLFLLGGPGSVFGSLRPNSVQEPSSLDPDFVYAVKDEELEEFCLPPSPVPHSAYADFAATVPSYLPNRRLLTPRLGGGLARFLSLFSWQCTPCSQPLTYSCSPAFRSAFSYGWLSCCDCPVFTHVGCCVLEVKDVVKVSGPLVMLFDVLAAVDAFGALLAAAAVIAFCLLGMKAWIFLDRQESQVSQVQVVPQHVQLPMRELFPDCWEHKQSGLGTHLWQDLGFRAASCATLPSSKTWRICRWTRFVQQPVRW